MYTDLDKKLILNYLERNYPVQRLKINNRFKRVIVLDIGGVHLLGDPESLNKLRFNLIILLTMIFSYNETFINSVLNDFSPLQPRG